MGSFVVQSARTPNFARIPWTDKSEDSRSLLRAARFRGGALIEKFINAEIALQFEMGPMEERMRRQ